ncbi:MAG TPA: MATE family efflux transporter [Rhodobacteraceae bacterium]|nr:MATE family efflux transporter [Amylibacter sp.]MDG1999648.1 MATE family efflux transporter [Amylibacter sp.]HAD29108.1 MATE family efflux transporter [Paracoccaceae bacterium]|tara:strand:+ start:3377 stop:4705 length:1329 start_codon:yes stop_codon:yes gene_type:complete
MNSAAAPRGGLTHRRVLNVAIPIVISNATVPILGAVDTGVVGQMGLAAPIGAVGIGAITLTAIYWVFGFLRMGTAGLTAQALGARDQGEVCALLVRGLIIGFAGGLLLLIFQVPIFWAAFQLAPASAEVERLAHGYLQIRIWSGPAAIAVYGLTGWLVAHERTKAVLVLQLWMNGVNILLDLWFVLGLGWGVEGVAAATVIAEISGLGIGLWLVRDGFQGQYWKNWAVVFDRVILKRLAIVNSDIIIRSVLLEICLVSFLFLGSAFDDTTLAANQVLIQFLFITAHGMDGFAFAAEALIGQALGAKDRGRLRRSVMLTSFWGAMVIVILTTAFVVFGGWLIDVMTKAPEVQVAARVYLVWMILAPFLGGPSWMLDGIFIGATRTKDMRNMMLVSFGVYWLSVWLLLEPFGNHGLWAALIIFFVARGVTLAVRYPALERAVDR